LSLQRLANDWRLQARDLRADLRDLQALGWLSFKGGMHGTTIELHEPLLPDRTNRAESRQVPPKHSSLLAEIGALDARGAEGL
jgi:hypothetical protein